MQPENDPKNKKLLYLLKKKSIDLLIYPRNQKLGTA